MSMKRTLKAVLMTTALCALAGLANSASAASCTSTRGECTTPPVNAGPDRRVTVRCTINAAPGRDAGTCKVVEAATGRAISNRYFVRDSGPQVIYGPTAGAYRCTVRSIGRPATVSCTIN